MTAPTWPGRWLQDHVRAIDNTFAQWRAKPLGTLLTLLVIGVTLALPAGIGGLLQDFAGLGYRLGQQSLQATLFLKDSVDEQQGRELAKDIARRPGVAASRYISRAQALKEFENNAVGGDALRLLDTNPLPASIVVTPDAHGGEARTQALLQKLAKLPEVDRAQLDQQWLRRLYALFDLAGRVLLVVSTVLAVTVVIVIGNTLRLDIENRREEIEVMKLVGASDGYVRRPFLYGGLCYGLGGAILALLLVEFGLLSLQDTIRALPELNAAGVTLNGLGFDAALGLLGCGLALGWLAAFWTVSRHLHRIEPR